MNLKSSSERAFERSIGMLHTSIETICHVVSSASPLISDHLNGVCSQLRSQLSEIARIRDLEHLDGTGDTATTIRRMYPEAEAELIIKKGLPVPYDTAPDKRNDTRQHILNSVKKHLGRMDLFSKFSYLQWASDGSERFGTLRVGMYTLYPEAANYEELESGLHGCDSAFRSGYENHTAFLAVRITGLNQTVVLVGSDGSVTLATYVPLEERWALHERIEFITTLAWDTAFQELLLKHDYVTEDISLSKLIDVIEERLLTDGLEPQALVNTLPKTDGYPGDHARPLTLFYCRTDGVTSYDIIHVVKGLNRFCFQWSKDRTVMRFSSLSTRQMSWDELPISSQLEIRALVLDAVGAEAAEIQLGNLENARFDS